MITTISGTKTISYVLCIHDIDQNLLSAVQLIEKGLKVDTTLFLMLLVERFSLLK